MIVYKWVNKIGDKYYSLMNYGFCSMSKKYLTTQLPYEIGKTYIDDGKQCELLKQQYYNNSSFIRKNKWYPEHLQPGFYFWSKLKEIDENRRKRMYKLDAKNIVTLKCEIKENDILPYPFNCIRAKKFKVLKEIKEVK